MPCTLFLGGMAFLTAKVMVIMGEDILSCQPECIPALGLCLLCLLSPSLGSLARAGHTKPWPKLLLVWRPGLGFRGLKRIRDKRPGPYLRET